MKVRDSSIGTRLLFGFGALLMIMVLISATCIYRMSRLADETRAMMEVPLTKERLVSELATSVTVGITRTTAVARSSDQSLATFFAAEAKDSSARGVDLLNRIDALANDDDKVVLSRLRTVRENYLAARNQIMKAKGTASDEEIQRLLEQQYLPTSKSYSESLQALIQLQHSSLDASARQIDASATGTRNLLITVAACVFVIGAVFARWLTKGITAPIADAVKTAKHVAAGNLAGVTVVEHAKDETGQLLQALEEMRRSLNAVVSETRRSAETIDSACGEVAAGNLDLSSRTEHQASSLEETAASMEELAATVRQNTDNARQANELAVSASEVASDGGRVVSQVVETMAAINESSRKVVDIIGVIESIAFQTNILALNAAVEAARAGEQGRGFAVVASEVRTLAQRAAAAAKEIKMLIDDSVQRVHQGSELVGRASATMDDIVASVKRVTGIMGEITIATNEQSSGIEQVKQAITQIDEVTQQNAALVEETSAAAVSMQDQAKSLTKAVAFFKLGPVPAR